MSTSQAMGRSLRAALVALLVVAPGALLAARILSQGVRAPVLLDGGGAGPGERVELVRHGVDEWLDASVQEAGSWRVVSTTRVPGTDGAGWSVAVERVAAGDVRVRVRNAAGRATSWRRDGLAFVRVVDDGS